MILYGYALSSASYRVRIALALKQRPYESIIKNLRAGEHRQSDYLNINLQGFVPSLGLDDGAVLGQSVAIIEYLDEIYPDPPLLPSADLLRSTTPKSVLSNRWMLCANSFIQLRCWRLG